MAESRQNREKSVAQKRQEMEAFDQSIYIKSNLLEFGYVKFNGQTTTAWLLNMVPSSILDEFNEEQACLEMYFLERETNNTFKGTFLYRPYFYIYVHEKYIIETTRYLEKTYSGHISITVAQKVDLDLPNHLSGKLAKYLRLSFTCVRFLLEARKEIMSYVKHNQSVHGKHSIYTIPESSISSFNEAIFDIREYDVPYYVRVCIDNDIRTGAWYEVMQARANNNNNNNNNNISNNEGFINVRWLKDMVEKANPKILAYDIECTKEALKFPNSDNDSIYMISYMIDGKGYLIVDREIVSKNISGFEYTPKEEFKGDFTVYNENNELDLIKKFFTHIQEEKPNIVVTFNGDKFDMQFLEERAKKYNLNMADEIGFYLDSSSDSYRGRNAVHMDAFCWVERDSYLPQGARGLKAVTRHKLGYDPVEINPEDMLTYAVKDPQYMATYSVSDAVATYYLYMQYVHLFVFSLCTIIPMNAEDVLRKGSGTLCEMLLQVEAYRGNIICPNKQVSDPYTFHKGHWIETDTYIGGHVECLESGVFRSDLPVKFRLDPTAFQYLIDTIDSSLTFHIEVEEGLQRCDVINYEEIKSQIIEKLEMLRDSPICNDKPILYHLDVAAMYPNIILTNRLQPSAIVNPQICSSCLFNKPENECKRRMKWEWRGEMYPLKYGEFKQIKRQLEEDSSTTNKKFLEMSESEQVSALKKRTKEYCRKVYGKLKVVETEVRDATICQRENSFYVNTVRSFRDRRYDYKKLTKKWNGVLKDIMKEIENAKTKVVLFDSLQLAHKCILNSFYGYVMRKGSRWMSMEMAGVVTHTGSNLITEARELVERIGRPLELDTDGIWCILPQSFPDVYTFILKDGKKLKINYPSCMLNSETHTKYTNHQYQQLVNEKERKYAMRSECSIFFELDGPYRAMVLPASLEEGKLLKKRYAVFNFDGSLQELKGFELKRRGELQIIKIFQSQVFERFLLGNSLQECYDKVGETANYWLDVLYTHGKDMEDEELIDLISENRSMSRILEEYGEQKSTSITTATRLKEVLGEDMVKDKGLNCKFVVSKKPTSKSVSERAIPTVIFSMEQDTKLEMLKKWTEDNGLTSCDIRDIIDWDYYIERFGSCVQKIVTIPAAIQRAQNPVPRIVHPPWLKKLINDSLDTRKQIKIDSMFSQKKTVDIEDLFKQDRINNNINNNEQKQISFENGNVMEIEEDDNDNEEVNNDIENGKENCNINKSIMMNEDLKQWYMLRKEEWKKMRSIRKSKRQEIFHNISNSGNINSIIKPTDNLQSYFNQQQRITALGYWQIIEICDLSSNGNLKLWAFTSRNTLQTITIHVEKTFYVNTLDDNLPIGKKVKKILPHNHKLYNLYEIKMSDYDYHHPSKELLSILQSHNVRGIYEVNVPYLYKTLIQIGCITRVSKERRMKSNNTNKTTFNVEDLEYLTTSDYGYLMNETSSFIKLYLYCVETGNSNNYNGIWMLFTLLPDNDKDINISIWEVSDKNNDMYNVGYKKLFNEIKKQNNISSYSSLHIKVNKVNSKNEFFKQFNKYIMDYQSSQKGPTIIITQTPYTSEILRIDVASLREMPLVPLLYPSEDGKIYQSLSWKNEFAELSFNRFFKMNDLWEEKLGISRFTHIPIGNLTTDIVIEASDIFYGRLLTFNRHLLWANTSAFPDLGGYLMQNYIDSVFSNNSDVTTHFEQSNQGVYRSVCIELKIRNLVINTIRMSDHLSDMEDIETDDISQQFGFCDTAYNILRMLVSRWISTAESTDLHLVDYFLGNCYRWLCSKSSLLYDPSIHSMICTLIKKVLILILTEFRHLGANIVYASFDKIILCSNRFTLESAESYLQYILDSISNQELFKYLVFEPQIYWDSLIWMDSYNYGGIILKNCSEEEEEEREEEMNNEEMNNEEKENENNKQNIMEIEEDEEDENEKESKEKDDEDNFKKKRSRNEENENQSEEEDEDAELKRIVEKHFRKKRRTNERTQQYHDSDSDDDDDEIDNSDNGMEEEDDDEEEDDTLNGFIVDDEEIETSTGKIYRTEKGEANHVLKEKQAEQQQQQEGGEGGIGDGKKFSLHWLTATFLPAFLDAPFQVIIADFLLKPLNYRNDLIKEHPESTFDEINEKMTEFTKMYIKQDVFPTLSKLVKNIHDKVIEDDPETKTDRAFPKFAGSYLNLTSPTLEYIKVICKILGLEECIDLEVYRLKTNLLSLIKKRESSEECQYKNLCLSLIVTDVICSYCNECQNIDFCRDSSFLFPVNESNNMWVCEHCSHPYNKLSIEYKLVELLDELISKYHYQDLRCIKCKNAKDDNLSSNCNCGGEYVNSEISSTEYIKLLTPFENIANYHQLNWLKEVINTYKN